jgi:hypothetical protein
MEEGVGVDLIMAALVPRARVVAAGVGIVALERVMVNMG